MYSDSEDESARRQIREDHNERQEEIGYPPGNYPIVIRRGTPPAPVKLTWLRRLKRVWRIAIGR